LASEAFNNVLDHAKISSEKFNRIKAGMVSGDDTFQSNSTIMHKNFGISNGAAFDISAACSGFAFALDAANLSKTSSRAKCIVHIRIEKV
jgi:3-oxoacyl-[acyl-carrier-protein] synthase-3